MRLEDLLVQEGVAVPAARIRRVLDGAAATGEHAVAALVDQGVIAEDVLAEVLARACSTVVVDLDREPELDAAQHLSRTLAVEHLALPVSSSPGGRLRVAFANPLDQDARELVEAAVGGPVQPLVAPLGPLRRAIERAFTGRSTRVVAGRPEIAAEQTRKMEAPSVGTAPLHRMEQEATEAQRHEALLLALIERGVITRADYAAALKRLLSGRRDD
ncbi:MAG: hypothetical protein KF729_19330 [Sandaracinaceae bacterium]|nr:hypothetical protein [Sandaracinaceae bacterium]